MQEHHSSFSVRPPNWLPLPGEEVAPRRRQAVVDEQDLFRKGEVASFYPRQRSGAVRSERGELFPFELDQIAVLGEPERLEAQARVGFDLSRTSHGYRVTKLKIY